MNKNFTLKMLCLFGDKATKITNGYIHSILRNNWFKPGQLVFEYSDSEVYFSFIKSQTRKEIIVLWCDDTHENRIKARNLSLNELDKRGTIKRHFKNSIWDDKFETT